MDEISHRILEILQDDARAEPESIATMLGRDVESVRSEIDRLERSRVIVRRKTLINWERAGVDSVSALVEVRVSPQRDVGFDAIAARIARFPDAWSVYLVSGAYDLSVQVVGRTMQEVADFVQRRIATLDGVQGTTTHFLMKRFKDDGELLDGDDEIERLPITP